MNTRESVCEIKEINQLKEIQYAEQLLAWTLEIIQDLGVEVRFFEKKPKVTYSANGGGMQIIGTSFALPIKKSFDVVDKALMEISLMGAKHSIKMIEKELFGIDNDI